MILVSACLLIAFLPPKPLAAQVPQTPPEPVEKLGPDLLRIGNIRVDTEKREISVPGVVNATTALEFIASSKGGFKNYESAIALDASPINFNLALILIGMDKKNAVPSTRHFDPNPPEGDPVEIWVEWQQQGGGPRKVRAEELAYNFRTRQTLPHGPWVYTGSVFLPDGKYLAELDGVLIGFVHTPAPIIENPAPDGLAGFGSFRLNPELNLPAETPVKVTVKALKKTDKN